MSLLHYKQVRLSREEFMISNISVLFFVFTQENVQNLNLTNCGGLWSNWEVRKDWDEDTGGSSATTVTNANSTSTSLQSGNGQSFQLKNITK